MAIILRQKILKIDGLLMVKLFILKVIISSIVHTLMLGLRSRGLNVSCISKLTALSRN